MDNQPQQPHFSAGNIARLCRRHFRLITVFLGSVITLAILALVFNHRASSNNRLVSSIPLPTPTSLNHHMPQEMPSSNQGNWVSVKVLPGDTLSKLSRRQQFNLHDINQILALGKQSNPLRHLQPGHELHVFLNNNQNIEKIIYKPDMMTVLTVAKENNVFKPSVTKIPLESRQAYAHGKIDSSLFCTAAQNGISHALMTQLVDIFQYDIDFAKAIHKGDTFSLIYEENFLNGELVSTGKILAAELVNHGKTYLAIGFNSPNNHRFGYYTPEGRSLRRQFTRTPVKYARISSRFTECRWHPVLHRMRSHKGVDYAAPTGTPVKCTANGVIDFVGRKGGYGNAVIIQHGARYSTLYGHLSRFAPHIRRNAPVSQGQVIGYVGMTGLATGPHLHYEFRIDNKHHDPLNVALPKGDPVRQEYHQIYVSHAKHLMSQLLIHEQTELATNHKTHHDLG